MGCSTAKCQHRENTWYTEQTSRTCIWQLINRGDGGDTDWWKVHNFAYNRQGCHGSDLANDFHYSFPYHIVVCVFSVNYFQKYDQSASNC
jgi:hypothetical protein